MNRIPVRLLRWLLWGLIVLASFAVLMFLGNNYSLRRASRPAFNKQLDSALDRATQWIADNRVVSERNPSMMYMIADMERMSHDPRLKALLDDYQNNYLTHPIMLFDFVWYRLVIRNANVPLIQVPDMHGALNEAVWDAYAIAPDKILLSPGDRAAVFSPTRFSWGARQHQLLTLVMYRDYNGSSPELDSTMHYLEEKIARDAHIDFRVTDSYIQRTGFLLAAGRPDLIRPRWIDRILTNQNPDGSWYLCWYGWCRGLFEFSTDYRITMGAVGHPTVQAAWALTMLKYRYPQWIDEHYH